METYTLNKRKYHQKGKNHPLIDKQGHANGKSAESFLAFGRFYLIY